MARALGFGTGDVGSHGRWASRGISMLHLCECEDMHTQYWDFFFNLSHHLGFDLPEHKPVFLATRCFSCKKMAPEEVIGIFSIAWRCLYAELTKSRLENHIFSAKDAKRRAICMIHSRLTAYGKLCRIYVGTSQWNDVSQEENSDYLKNSQNERL